MCDSWLFWPIMFCAFFGFYFVMAGITILIDMIYNRASYKSWGQPDVVQGLGWPIILLGFMCIYTDTILSRIRLLCSRVYGLVRRK
jgi:hypothetical protein